MIMRRIWPFVFLVLFLGCASEKPVVSNRISSLRFQLPRFSLKEIITRTWQQDGQTITLIRQIDLPTSDSRRPDCKAMIFGLSKSGVALCIEFYGYDSRFLDDRQYYLMKRDWYCPPVGTSVSVHKQNDRVFFRVEGDSQEPPIVHRTYDYELTPQFQLIEMPSEFMSKKDQS